MLDIAILTHDSQLSSTVTHHFLAYVSTLHY